MEKGGYGRVCVCVCYCVVQMLYCINSRGEGVPSSQTSRSYKGRDIKGGWMVVCSRRRVGLFSFFWEGEDIYIYG